MKTFFKKILGKIFIKAFFPVMKINTLKKRNASFSLEEFPISFPSTKEYLVRDRQGVLFFPPFGPYLPQLFLMGYLYLYLFTQAVPDYWNSVKARPTRTRHTRNPITWLLANINRSIPPIIFVLSNLGCILASHGQHKCIPI